MSAANEPLISVIVTAYNIEEYIAGCLDSLVAQTYPNIEFLVVDDGSTDHTGAIIDSYAEKHPKIHAIHRLNGGPSAARNTGLEVAKGAYIGYVDGDDWIEPNMYEDMLRALRAYNAQIAICSYKMHGDGAEETKPTGDVFDLTREETLSIYIKEHEQYHIYHAVWCKLYERSTIKDILFREGRKSEDIMYSTCAFSRADKCVFLDTEYYHYRMDRTSSIMNTKLEERRFEDEIPFTIEQISYLQGMGMDELSEYASYQFYRRLLFYYIDFRTRKMNEAAKRMAKYIQNDRPKIKQIYKKDFVAKGDSVRMKLMLQMPGVYYILVRLYDKFVIPMRSKAKESK